jgi:diguanylate cyclase (GGDEF)-like protein/PAS domain S-box-containing protein
MDDTLHTLLIRQLKRLGLDADQPPLQEKWTELLGRITRAYQEADQDRYSLERSQEISSREMHNLNKALQAERDRLENRVQERTEALQLSEARLSSLLSLSSDWIWEQDADLRYTFFSEGLLQTTGINPQEVLNKRRPIDLTLQDNATECLQFINAIEQRKPFKDFTYKVLPHNSSTRFIRVSGEPIFDAQGVFKGYRGVGTDVTSNRLAEEKIHQLARYDSLTGLPNRNMFLSELERALTRAQLRSSHVGLLYIDLDRFKNINDSLGHQAGDELLVIVAERLKGLLRHSDLVARLGGDEYVVLIDGLSQVTPHSAGLSDIARKVLQAINLPILLQGRTYRISGSIGIAEYPEDASDSATLLKNADSAMYLAKAQGKNNYQFYTAHLSQKAANLFSLESDLRAAIESDELILHFQPKINLEDKKLRGVEALIRWHHPQKGLLMPGAFIELAEESGLIVPMGRWVMNAACRQVRAWIDEGLGMIPCAINISARQFSDDLLITDVESALKQYQLPPSALEVEITESVLMADPDHANQLLDRLFKMGIEISIDDFGTGYSSLAYLKRFPAHTVKIDRSFIKGLPDDKDDMAITQAVIAMSKSLGLSVVAEGVETQEQQTYLNGVGCTEAQGYFIGRPMPNEKFVEWLKGHVK